jgi:hypothetical protein
MIYVYMVVITDHYMGGDDGGEGRQHLLPLYQDRMQANVCDIVICMQATICVGV